MFGNNNAGGDKINVNTNLDTLWSDISSLVIGCWNYKISLKWSPAVGKDMNGRVTYDPKGGANTAMSHSKTAALIGMYERDTAGIKTAYESKADPGAGINVSIRMEGRQGTYSWISLEYKPSATGTPAMFLTLTKCEQGGNVLGSISYQFQELQAMVNMDSGKAAGGEPITVHSEFDYFIDLLKSHIFITGITTHAEKLAKAYGGRRGNTGMDADAAANAFAGNMSMEEDGLSVFS